MSTQEIEKKEKRFTLGEIEQIIIERHKGTCYNCEAPITTGSIRSWDHVNSDDEPLDNGIYVSGTNKPQWVYFECVCGLQISLRRAIENAKVRASME